ncbi:hypothetical protein ACFYTQ_04030 [Nocardia sp. NPDC004068]|uniref:hypothetical protein n=1 Tax=Nocardia sp. NPDC004068 TaxID=3364303 RepID=UPI0036CC15ED
MSDPPRPGGTNFDAVERMDRQPEDSRTAETGRAEAETRASKVIRLPHRPRRTTEDTPDRRRKPRQPEGGAVYDPAPTRPVMRSELQETGAWPVDLRPAWQHTPVDVPDDAERDGSVIDLGASRRKRASAEAPGAGIRRVAKPRRIGPDIS